MITLTGKFRGESGVILATRANPPRMFVSVVPSETTLYRSETLWVAGTPPSNAPPPPPFVDAPIGPLCQECNLENGNRTLAMNKSGHWIAGHSTDPIPMEHQTCWACKERIITPAIGAAILYAFNEGLHDENTYEAAVENVTAVIACLVARLKRHSFLTPRDVLAAVRAIILSNPVRLERARLEAVTTDVSFILDPTWSQNYVKWLEHDLIMHVAQTCNEYVASFNLGFPVTCNWIRPNIKS